MFSVQSQFKPEFMKYQLFSLLFLTFLFLCAFLFHACDDRVVPVAGDPEVVTEGFLFTEGPYWHPDGFLIFSDIPASIVYKWTPGNPESEVYIEPSGNSNGINALPDGTILIAQHAGRVSEVGDEKELIPIAEEYNGMRLNSPNDIAVRSDGLIYFTDPPFGVSDEDRELDFSGVYRISRDGSLTLLFDEFALPNGIIFSPDEEYLYINDSETGQILRFDVLENGDIENPRRFANVGAMGELGGADGMVTDTEGRLYTTGPNGFIVFDPEGRQIHQIRFDHQITNMTWGEENLDVLYITSPNAVYRLEMNTQGWR
jgi:gluconolactonase